MSTSPGPPPFGGIYSSDRVLAIIQLVRDLYPMWSQLETLREERARREQDLRRDRAKLKAQLTAFEWALSAQVSLEGERAKAFVTALRALGPVQDPQVAVKLLEAAGELLRHPFALPVLLDDAPRRD
jgi:glutathione S-transferase